MIVLVDARQFTALSAAEEKADRFEREVETGVEATTSPLGGFPTLTATPEPEEWVLIAFVLAALLMHAHRRGYGRTLADWRNK